MLLNKKGNCVFVYFFCFFFVCSNWSETFTRCFSYEIISKHRLLFHRAKFHKLKFGKDLNQGEIKPPEFDEDEKGTCVYNILIKFNCCDICLLGIFFGWCLAG